MWKLRGTFQRSGETLRPYLWVLCLAFGLGILLGRLVQKSVPAEDYTALATYLERYAQLSSDPGQEPASWLSAALTYLRYPAAVFLLGLVAPGLFLIPVLCMVQGFFLSYSVSCFASALGRSGVKLALCAFGVRCIFVLPCTFFLAACGMRSARRLLQGGLKRGQKRLDGLDKLRLGLCALLLGLGVLAELSVVPKLFQLALAGMT